MRKLTYSAFIAFWASALTVVFVSYLQPDAAQATDELRAITLAELAEQQLGRQHAGLFHNLRVQRVADGVLQHTGGDAVVGFIPAGFFLQRRNDFRSEAVDGLARKDAGFLERRQFEGFARLQARGNRPLGGQLQRVGGDVHPALLGLAHVAAVNVDADFVPVVFQVRVRGGGQTDLHGLHRLVLLQLVEFRAVGGDDRREIEGDLGRVLRLDLPFLRDRQEVV